MNSGSSVREESGQKMDLVSKKKLEEVIQLTTQTVGKKLGKDVRSYLQKQTNLAKQQVGQMQEALLFHERQRSQILLEEPKLAQAMRMDYVEPEIQKEGQLNEQTRDILLQAYGLQDTWEDSEMDFLAEIADCSKEQGQEQFNSLKSSTQSFISEINKKIAAESSNSIPQQEQHSPQSTNMEIDPPQNNNSNKPIDTNYKKNQQPKNQQQKQQLQNQNQSYGNQSVQGIQSTSSSPLSREGTPNPRGGGGGPNFSPSASNPLPTTNIQSKNNQSGELPQQNQSEKTSYSQHIDQQLKKVQNLMKNKKLGGEAKWGTIQMWMQYESNNTVRLFQMQALASLPRESISNQLNANAPQFFEIVEKWIRGGFDRGDGEFLSHVFEALISMPIKYSHPSPSFVKFIRKTIIQNTLESLVDPLEKFLQKIEKQAPKREPAQLPVQQPTGNQNSNKLNNQLQAVTGGISGPLARGAAVKVKSQKDKPLTADEILKRNRLKRLNKQVTQQANKKLKSEQKQPMQNTYMGSTSMGINYPPQTLSSRGQQRVNNNNNNTNTTTNNKNNTGGNKPPTPTPTPTVTKNTQKTPMVAPPTDASPEEHFQYLKQQQQKQRQETQKWEKQQLQDISFNLQLMIPQLQWQQPIRSNIKDTTYGDDSIELGVQQTRALCQPAYISLDPGGICIPREPANASNAQNVSVNSPAGTYEIPFVPKAEDEFKTQNLRLWQSDQRLKEYVVDPNTLT